MNQWKPYLIAVTVGLLVGIEREKSKADQKALGVRTFILLSLLGAIAGDLQTPWLTAILTVFALGLIFSSYVLQFFSKDEAVQLGLTTEFAGGIVYAIGYASHDSPILSATIGPFVALILVSKSAIHRFTHAINPLELKTTITLLLIAVTIVDLAPDTALDPWGLFNPRKFGYLILILATLEFSSYVLLKIIGEKKGSLAVGFLGGLVSSTAVLFSSARQATKNVESWRTLLGSTIAAQLASLTELLLIIFLISPELFLRLAPSVIAGISVGSIALLIILKNTTVQYSELILKSPLDWKGVFRLSFIFTTVLVLISIAKHWFGTDATYALSFLTGLFELQGISLATATLFSHDQLSIQTASTCILIAVAASLVTKIIVSWFFSRNKFAFFLTSIFLPMIGIIVLVGWLSSN
ncbi:MAG: MgtC/SapB family protein [Pseudobdellovibrio sp.]